MATIWMNGQLVNEKDAKISVFDHGLLYGDGCFEGIRVYNGRIFKMMAHLERLYRSAEKLSLKIPYTINELADALRVGVEAHGALNAYIRPVVTRGYGNLGINPFQCEKPEVIIITATIQLYPQALYATGMKIVTAQRPRVDRRALDPSIKSLNYLNNVLAKIEATKAGVYEAVMLNHEGNVSECTGDNIFMIKDGEVITPPVDAGILEGITRNFVLHVCREIGIPCAERNFKIHQLKEADEVFLTGTAAEIMSVTHIDDVQIGEGTPGPITKRLLGEFRTRTGENAPED